METKIIPTLFSLKKEEFNEKLEKLKFAKALHIDFMDGGFTKSDPSVSFSDMGRIKNLKGVFLEAHLMAFSPEKYIEDLKNLNVVKVLIHFEAFDKRYELIEVIGEFRKNFEEVFIVINPDTEIKKVLDFLNLLDGILIMGVNPGSEGQDFLVRSIEKIKYLKTFLPKFLVQVDGGINLETSKKCIKAGAKILNVGSYISGSDSPKERLEKLESE